MFISTRDDQAQRLRTIVLSRAARAALLAAAVLLLGAGVADAGQVAVYPIPGSRLATVHTEIAFRGIAVSKLGPISASGSRSGAHPGRIAPDSDGDGASFIPSTPFDPGETVTVRTFLHVLNGRGGSFRFKIETPDGSIYPPPSRYATPRVRGDVVRYRSQPGLSPSAIRITHQYSGAKDVFLTPMRGPLQFGPMIIDRFGHLVWFYPVPGPTDLASNFQVQRFEGQPVLTWWEGYVNFGVGQGRDVIFDRHYRPLALVSAGNGLNADLHEFTLTRRGTALITSYSLVRWNASSIGASKHQKVMNCTVQEIDIRTGRVLFQWDSLDHIPVKDTYEKRPPNGGRPFDYFHLNSVQRDFDGNLIISARNTWAVYKINYRTGAVMWELGGKHSSFKMGPGTSTAFQHHANVHSGALVTIFDDGATPQVHRQSRALLERLNVHKHTVTLVREFDHSPSLVTPFEGSVQLLPNGHVFVGWGAQPYFSEYDRRGHQIYDGRIVGGNSSYRAYEFNWNSQPDTTPALAVSPKGKGATVYASWNGATDVDSWQVLAGSSPTSLKLVATAKRDGFETAIRVGTREPYFAVRALSSGRRALATSAAAAG